jgi:hypothetical protein
MKLFATGFIQVFFVAINTYLISKGIYLGVFVCGFMISLVWSWNIRRISISTLSDRIFYSLGAASGSVMGLFASVQLTKLL